MQKLFKRILYVLPGLVIVYLLLLIPDAENKTADTRDNNKSFVWDRDAQWLQMENQYRQAKQMDPVKLDSVIAGQQMALDYIPVQSVLFPGILFLF
jgi:hypothetical protein